MSRTDRLLRTHILLSAVCAVKGLSAVRGPRRQRAPFLYLCMTYDGGDPDDHTMTLAFKPIEARDLITLEAYCGMRPNKTCDSMPLDSFLWRGLYGTQFAISDDRAVQWLLRYDGMTSCAMPDCIVEDLPHYFYEMVDYFREELDLPFVMDWADEEAIDALHLQGSPNFAITEQQDYKDYLYSAEALRSLSGKALHKKKNLVNRFMRDYAGRYEYRQLSSADQDEISVFLDEWQAHKEDDDPSLEAEVRGIRDVVRSSDIIPVSMAGVYVDGKLESFTMGSYNAAERMAIISTEKANASIGGLYQFINQQFLINAFPDAVVVNREDDMGDAGLRQAKESYHPLGFARKYRVTLA